MKKMMILGMLSSPFVNGWWLSSSTLPRRLVYPRARTATTTPTTALFDAKSADSLNSIAINYDDQRDVPSLQEWAIDQGVELSDGIELTNNGFGDWGVSFFGESSLDKGSTLMTIPKSLILSSSDRESSEDLSALQESVTASMSESNMEYFVPECLLMIRVLQEQEKGEKSHWKPWLDTLPKSFDSGLYFDPLERSHALRLAPEFLRHQDVQFLSCKLAIQVAKDNNLIPKEVVDLLNDEDDLESVMKWAFSAVFTRSWRSQDGTVANLVPLGDMFNHDSEKANVAPKTTDDGGYQLSLKEDVVNGTSLFLSYGLTHRPERFLIIFGFTDRSGMYMDANLTVPEGFSVDRSSLLVSTKTGSLTEEVWALATYNVLLQRDVDMAVEFATAQADQDVEAIQQYLDRYDFESAMYLRLHVLKLLGETYPEMDLVPENLSESPRRFGMIARYNNLMRDTWERVGKYLDEEIEISLKLRSAAKARLP